MNKKTINIFFTINNGYSCYLATAMASILINSKTSNKLAFYILDGGISEDNKRKIEQLKVIKDFSIEYLPVSKQLFANMPNSCQAHISNETNYRFLISSLKPDIDKCIFIDADLVFADDIALLWNIDVDGYYMAAVTDQAPLKKGSWVEKLPLPKGFSYVNTGVTVMNLKKWREDNIEKKLFKNVSKFQNLLKYPDQDTLNLTLAPCVKYLSHVFNAMPVQKYYREDQKTEAFSSPVVIHWAGQSKPWINPQYKMADVFWKYARLTPFYEEIFYTNVSEVSLNKMILNTVQRFEIVRDIANHSKNIINYFRCKLLQSVTFGKLREHYKNKKRVLKTKVKNVRRFLKGK